MQFVKLQAASILPHYPLKVVVVEKHQYKKKQNKNAPHKMV